MRLASVALLLMFAATAAWVWARSGSWAVGVVLAALYVALWLVGHALSAEPLVNAVERRAGRKYRRLVADLEAREPEVVGRARDGDAAALEQVRHRLRYEIAGADTEFIAGLLVPEEH